MKKIAIGCDHTVVNVKQRLVEKLEQEGYDVIDYGTYSNERTHYPIYGQKVALSVVNEQADLGIVICGTGVGITNATNKVKGARCSLVRDIKTAKRVREAFDSNILGIGGRILGIGIIEQIVDEFLNTKFEEKNKPIKEYLDNLIEEKKEVSFDKEIKLWNEGYYHD